VRLLAIPGERVALQRVSFEGTLEIASIAVTQLCPGPLRIPRAPCVLSSDAPRL